MRVRFIEVGSTAAELTVESRAIFAALKVVKNAVVVMPFVQINMWLVYHLCCGWCFTVQQHKACFCQDKNDLDDPFRVRTTYFLFGPSHRLPTIHPHSFGWPRSNRGLEVLDLPLDTRVSDIRLAALDQPPKDSGGVGEDKV